MNIDADSELLLDDRHPDILYFPDEAWVRAGNNQEYRSTTTCTKHTGAKARVTFEGTFFDLK